MNMMKIFSIIALMLVSVGSHAFDISQYGNKEGQTIVFVPGLASHGELWQPWVDQYKDTHNIFVMTAPGFAGVEAVESENSFLQARADEIAVALKNAHIKDAYLIGHSIGGLMSLMVAEKYPSLVSKILVVDSLPFMAGLFSTNLQPEQAAAQAGFLKQQMSAMSREVFLAQQKQGAGILSKTPDFIPTLHRWAEASDQATIVNAYSEAFATDFRPNLAKVKAKTTVLAAYAPQMPVARPQIEALYMDQYKTLDGVDVQLIDDSFHFIMVDQKEAFGQQLDEFLK